MGYYDNVRPARYGTGSRNRGTRHSPKTPTEPQTRHFHQRTHCRHARVRPLDGGTLPVIVLAGGVRVRRRQHGRELQRRILGRVRHSLPSARDHVRVDDVVLAIPGMGADQLPAVVLPDAAEIQEVLHAVDGRRVAQQVPVLLGHVRLRLHLPHPVLPRHQPRRLQAHGHLLGVGHRHHPGPTVLRRHRVLEMGQAHLFPPTRQEGRWWPRPPPLQRRLRRLRWHHPRPDPRRRRGQCRQRRQ